MRNDRAILIIPLVVLGVLLIKDVFGVDTSWGFLGAMLVLGGFILIKQKEQRRKNALIIGIMFATLATLNLTLESWKARVEARKSQTQASLMKLGGALTNYHREFGAWPTSLDELNRNPKGIRFIKPDPPVLDGWGTPIEYSLTNFAGKFEPRLRSFAADRKPGGTGSGWDIQIFLGHR